MVKSIDQIRIFQHFREAMSMADFCNETNFNWDKQIYNAIEELQSNTLSLLFILEVFIDKSTEILNKHKSSKGTSFKIVNLAYLMVYLGCNFEINGKKCY